MGGFIQGPMEIWPEIVDTGELDRKKIQSLEALIEELETTVIFLEDQDGDHPN